MISPWQLLALRENETAMDVSGKIMFCVDLDFKLHIILTLIEFMIQRIGATETSHRNLFKSKK